MKVMSIMGTRPEMIKMWSTMKLLEESNFEHIFVHTGQNYTKELKDFFFRDLKLREPDHYLGIDVTSYGKEVADVVRKSDELFEKVKPDALLILGDTFSGLSVLPAANRGIKIFHLEAGLRAFDKRMPEQRNRVLIDHMSDILLPYYPYHRENLVRENIHPSKIICTGNPVFEVMEAFENEIDKSEILKYFDVKPGEYFSVTIHRRENVDNPEELQKILNGLGALYEKYGKKVIYLMHPRTQSKIHQVQVPKGITIHAPLGFYDFNCLNKHAFCLIGDSGSTPEEGIYFKKPVVSVRKTTERYETLEAGAHIVAGTDPRSLVESVETITRQTWCARFDLCKDFKPSNVIVNAVRSNITNFF
ncbi:MAG: non-hydrolyzing UDP-N-acetylglucosamine 2-epimerase [Bdellovibrionales bacterium]